MNFTMGTWNLSFGRLRMVGAFIVLALSLGACGGGGGGGASSSGASPSSGGGSSPATEDMDGSGPSVGTYLVFSATTAGATSGLQTIAIENGQALATLINGTLDHENNNIAGGDLTGSFDVARTEIILDSGGTITLTNLADAEFLRVFDGTINGQNVFGVVGVPTLPDDVPGSGSGTAIYNGSVQMSLQNSDGVYVLTGDAELAADWDSQNITTVFDNLSGELNTVDVGAVTGVLQIAGAPIVGAGFAGGELTTQTGVFVSDDPDLTFLHEGGLFGANADEAGGVLLIDATDLEVGAVFVAE